MQIPSPYISTDIATSCPVLELANQNGNVAVIDREGVFRVTIDPTEENTKAFIELVEKHLAHRQLTSMQYNVKS